MREKFVDEVLIDIRSGDGGNGCVSFRREKCVEYGGPDGGDGGRGGDVTCLATTELSTLLDYRYQRHHAAGDGERGRGCQCYGADGKPLVLRVPVGTQVYNCDTNELLTDLRHDGATATLARGGRGGRGNEHFKSSVRRAPKFAQPGEPGESLNIRLELKLMADVGIIGLPNVGKSAFVAHVSAARPKVANYPFTTLVPHLGVVRFGDMQHFVVADVPGLIAGAHQGLGLGARFLRHVERVRLLVHMLTVTPGVEERELTQDFEAIESELRQYNADLALRPRVVVLNQIDLPEVAEQLPRAKAWAQSLGLSFFGISAATGAGIRPLIAHLGYAVSEAKKAQAQRDAEALSHPPHMDESLAFDPA